MPAPRRSRRIGSIPWKKVAQTFTLLPRLDRRRGRSSNNPESTDSESLPIRQPGSEQSPTIDDQEIGETDDLTGGYAARQAEGSALLVYRYLEEAQKFGRRVAREAFERHVLQPETLTFEDLKASIGKGPCLDSSDIANTYYSDEEFLSALAARHGDTAAS